MSRTFHKADQLQSRSDVIAESCLLSQKYVVFQDIILMHDGELKTYKLKADHVPTKLSIRDDSIVASDASAHTVYEWLKFASAKGWFFEVHEVFPEMYISHDFDEMKIGEHGWSPEIAALQTQVTALDATFSTDIERQQAVTQLQSQIDANAASVSQEVSDRQAAIAQEVIDRDAKVLVEETRALGAEAQEVSDRQAAIAQEVIDRDAKVLVEETRALAAEQQEVSDRQSAVSGVQANVDAEAISRANADTSLTQEVSVERGRLDALFQANDVNFDTIREISDAFAQVSSTGLSQAITNNTNGVAQHTIDIAARRLISDSYSQSDVDGKVITAAQAQAIVNNSGKVSYDASASALVAQHTSDIAARRLVSDSYSQSDVDGKVITAAQAQAITNNSGKISYGDAAVVSGHTTQLAQKVGTTGAQSITENGTSAVLSLSNSTADQKILSCSGADGIISLIGGNVLDCDRPGRMNIRANDGSGSVALQSRGVDKIICDNQVRIKVAAECDSTLRLKGDVTLENKTLNFENAAGAQTVGLKCDPNLANSVTFTLPSADGSSGQVISSNGNGVLSFVAQSAGLSASDNIAFTGINSFAHHPREVPASFKLVVITSSHDSNNPLLLPVDGNSKAYGHYLIVGQNSSSDRYVLLPAMDDQQIVKITRLGNTSQSSQSIRINFVQPADTVANLSAGLFQRAFVREGATWGDQISIGRGQCCRIVKLGLLGHTQAELSTALGTVGSHSNEASWDYYNAADSADYYHSAYLVEQY